MLNDPASAAQSRPLAGERLLVLATYGLYLFAIVNGVTLLIGAVVAWIRLGHARGTVAESHYRNLLRVFWTVAIFVTAVLTLFWIGMWDMVFSFAWSAWQFSPWPLVHLPLWGAFVPFAALVSLVLGIWYLWRVIRGFILALDEKAY